ncbi:uncharacterized protein BDZ99DRAFT_519181 [Mytilinidion resinicola]|uniref:Peptidase C19 ubiquitin carboxyl-terminal hydrolase domain-containing protein n=1 Tax=Mytilinidion resinicola TaxID=574789 RepID=A0A6A6YT44_9PEZI|nr:uncharacterized protein BDZ99DRAFT_519181 [Mytilinidion resinicola]KAF2811941.1 hypothetical protein BDZ99DRAFT_519181 [Mytilinidion resinicola]
MLPAIPAVGPRIRCRTNGSSQHPEILVVKIRRDDFGETGETNRQGEAILGPIKIFDRIKANKTLNLTDFQENKDLALIYELSGVASHNGDDIEEGHCIAHTTGPEINGRTPVDAISDSNVQISTHKMLSQDPKSYHADPAEEEERKENFENYFAFYIKSSSSHPLTARVYAGLESTARPFGKGQNKRVKKGETGCG